MSTKLQFIILAGAAGAMSLTALPAHANVNISETGSKICIKSDGVPNHSTGRFPNRGNPHSMRAQRISVCVPKNPRKSGSARNIDRGAIGIGLNGIFFRPEAADYWDPNSPRGFSRRNTGWRMEPMGPRNLFGLDSQNAHVDRRGLYHYHGKSRGLLSLCQRAAILDMPQTGLKFTMSAARFAPDGH